MYSFERVYLNFTSAPSLMYQSHFFSIHIDLSIIGTTNFDLLINHSSLNLPPVLLMHLPRTYQGLQTHHHPALLGILHFKAISSIPSVSICTNIDSKLVHKTLIRRKR